MVLFKHTNFVLKYEDLIMKALKKLLGLYKPTLKELIKETKFSYEPKTMKVGAIGLARHIEKLL